MVLYSKKYEILGKPKTSAIIHYYDEESISTLLEKEIKGLEMLSFLFWDDIKKKA
jgi:hypothetical protein